MLNYSFIVLKYTLVSILLMEFKDIIRSLHYPYYYEKLSDERSLWYYSKIS